MIGHALATFFKYPECEVCYWLPNGYQLKLWSIKISFNIKNVYRYYNAMSMTHIYKLVGTLSIATGW